MTDLQRAELLYREAESLNARGDFNKARLTLTQASDLGHSAASFSLAVCELDGIGGASAKPAGLKRLLTLSRNHPPARGAAAVGLASGWSGREDWTGAIDFQVGHGAAGDGQALLDLGLLLLMKDPSRLGPQAAACFAAAIPAAAIEAAPVLTRYFASQGERFVLPPQLIQALQAQAYLPLDNVVAHASVQSRPPARPSPPDFEVIRTALADRPENWAGAPDNTLAEQISARVRLRAFHDCICDFVLARAAPQLSASKIFDPDSGSLVDHPHRRSLSATFRAHQQTLSVHALERIMASAAGIAWQNSERLVVLLYRKDEYYAPHMDYLEASEGTARAELARSGQRMATALTCLHAPEEGGETAFPDLATKWVPARGDLLTFANADPAGQPLPESRHEGRPVRQGWKALASLWLRERPYAGPAGA